MIFRTSIIALLLIATCGCGLSSTPLRGVPSDLTAQLDRSIFRAALGSCNKADRSQDYWRVILAADPDLWIWVGDAIYADTRDPAHIADEYRRQLAHPEYQALRASVPIIGVWDDHDYGDNNEDASYPIKDQSQALFLDFIGEPPDSPRRQQRGIHATHDEVLSNGLRLKVLLLDVRYHRQPPGGDILGEPQWAWLEQTLAASTADIHLIVSGSQVLRDDTDKDTWVEHPASQARLFDALARHRTPGVVLISGDIHVAEISRRDDTALGYPLYEFTSSGLTHARAPFTLENSHRIALFVERNFGVIDVTDHNGQVNIHLEVHDINGDLVLYTLIPLSSLQPPPAP